MQEVCADSGINTVNNSVHIMKNGRMLKAGLVNIRLPRPTKSAKHADGLDLDGSVWGRKYLLTERCHLLSYLLSLLH